MFENCIGDCGRGFGPPPDMILSMPPPPLPSFLLPKAMVPTLPTNESQPCFATFMCDPNPNPRESGIEFVELTGVDSKGLENTWLFILITSCVGVLILGGLLAVILLKCRETLFSSCNLSYHDSNMKQGTINTLGDNSKANPFMAGGILYPCTAVNTSRDTLQSQLANDNRLLWATLTPHGTRHFISDYPLAAAGNESGGSVKSSGESHPDSGHYEVVDYRTKTNQIYRDYVKRTPVKSFDNNGFIDYDYEDPTPLMESYHDDLDSGYQEPHEVIAGSTMHRISPRPIVSSPTRIDNPNIPPLNYYPTHRSQQLNASHPSTNTMPSNASTLNRKSTLNRRISDASAYGNPQM